MRVAEWKERREGDFSKAGRKIETSASQPRRLKQGLINIATQIFDNSPELSPEIPVQIYKVKGLENKAEALQEGSLTFRIGKPETRKERRL